MNRFVRVLCEGPEDLSALRELAERQWAYRLPNGLHGSGAGGVRQWRGLASSGDEIMITVAGSRAQCASWPDLILQGSADRPYSHLGVSFDPNGELEPVWRKNMFEKVWQGAPLRSTPDGCYEVSVHPSGVAVPVVPLPWSAPGPPFAGLEDAHSLDRLVAQGCAMAYPELTPMVERWIGDLRGTSRPVDHKTAAALWRAILGPRTDLQGFAARVMGQDKRIWGAVAPLIQSSPLWNGLKTLLG